MPKHSQIARFLLVVACFSGVLLAGEPPFSSRVDELMGLTGFQRTGSSEGMTTCTIPRELLIGGARIVLHQYENGSFDYLVPNESGEGVRRVGRGFCSLTASPWVAGRRVYEAFADSPDSISQIAARLKVYHNTSAGVVRVESTEGTLGFVKGCFAVVAKGGELGRLLAAELYDINVRRRGSVPPVKRMMPERLELWDCLKMDGLLSPAYLFNSIVTNSSDRSYYKEDYLSRVRGFVDLDGDGHEDVLLSLSEAHRGTGGQCYDVCLWTNGFYRCVGEVGGSGFRVDRQADGATLIWSYWHSSCQTGQFCCSEWRSWSGLAQKGPIPVVWAGEDEPCFAKALQDALHRYATVPIRWERSRTIAGTNIWEAVTGD